MSRIDLDGWTPMPFDLEREIARSREHLHRSIGQRARWALYAVRASVDAHREAMWNQQVCASLFPFWMGSRAP